MPWLISPLVFLLLGGVGHAAFEFVGGGARSQALGGAWGAGIDEAESVWFNPAGNGRLGDLRISSSHALLYPGLDQALVLNSLAAAVPVGGGALQMGLSTLDFTDWRERVGVLAYGRALHPRVSLGGAIRSSGWSTTGLSHRTWDADVGATYEVGWLHRGVYLRLAGVVANITRANISSGGYDAGQTGRQVVLAAALQVERQEIYVDLQRRDGLTRVRVGYETRAATLGGLHLRLGTTALSDSWDLSDVGLGFGHNWKQWYLDYAYTYPLQLTELGGMHRLGFGYVLR